MTRLFGTDGVRGLANRELTPELAVRLAQATASTIPHPANKVVIGRDTRTSGPMLEMALAAGFASSGLDVLLAGVVPTPAISFLIKDEAADHGAVVSASHNPPEDNGIKLFSGEGMKLPLDLEEEIERAMIGDPARGATIGKIAQLEAAAERYAAFLVGAIDIDDIDLTGTSIVVDCAFGATSAIAPRVFRHLKADVFELNTELAGEKINQACGTSDLGPLQAAVAEHGADLGIAFDGDGDRVLLVAEDGTIIDGDTILGIAACYYAENRSFVPNVVVATVMSNQGLATTLEKCGVRLLRTDVGDRNVAWEMRRLGAKVGGEQSGHIIFQDHSLTGDGILTAVKMLEISHDLGQPLGHLAARIDRHPQIKGNLKVRNPHAFVARGGVRTAIEQETQRLGDNGRLLVRPSGTQPRVRLLVEADDAVLAQTVFERLEKRLNELIAKR